MSVELVGWSIGCLGGLWLILVKVHELGKIELWLLKDLNLSDHAVVLKWEDLAALLLNLFTKVFLDKHLDEVLEG